jgi:hypothetical protein
MRGVPGVCLLLLTCCSMAGCHLFLSLSSSSTSSDRPQGERAPAHDSQLDRRSDSGVLDRAVTDRLLDRSPDRRGDFKLISLAFSLPSSKDTMIELVGIDSNYGKCPTAEMYRMFDVGNDREEHYKFLLAFDLSTIPATCSIDSASLVLTRQQAADKQTVTISVYRVIEDWNEGGGGCSANYPDTATWESRQPGVKWTTPGGGGTVDPTAVASQAYPPNTSGVSFDVTALAKGWRNGSYLNQGVLLDQPHSTTSNWMSWYTRDATSAALWPHLDVSCTCVAGD